MYFCLYLLKSSLVPSEGHRAPFEFNILGNVGIASAWTRCAPIEKVISAGLISEKGRTRASRAAKSLTNKKGWDCCSN